MKFYKKPFRHSWQLASQCGKSPYKVKQLLLFFRAARCRKSISLVTGKTARKIAARGGLVRTFHCDLVAVVELRHATRRQDKRIREFQTGDRRAFLTHEATVIVTAEKCDENFRIGVEIIFRECLGNLVDRLAFRERVSNRIEEREVEQRIET